MDKKKIVVIGVVGAGAYVAWSLFKSSVAQAAEDPYGNPEETRYDEEGKPEAPVFEPLPGEGMTEAAAQIYMAQQRAEDHTVPATEGGLRNHGSSLWYDSRFVAYGQLAQPLGAKDGQVFIKDDSYFWDGTSQGSSTPAAQEFGLNKTYRLMIDEEPIIARSRPSRHGPSRLVVFDILDRPNMSSWNVPLIPAFRLFDSAEQRARWPQYADRTNPVYPVGTWAQEQRANCSHENWNGLGQYRIWDPVLGDCRHMTDEERNTHVAWLAAREAEEERAASESSAAAQEACQKNWGLSCGEWQTLTSPHPAPTDDEARARVQALPERMTFRLPADIDAWFPQFGPSGHRAMPFPVDTSGETVAIRRERGRLRYASLDLLNRREFQRDLYALDRLGMRIAGRQYAGDFIIMALGGVYGLASNWGEPERATLHLAEPEHATVLTRYR